MKRVEGESIGLVQAHGNSTAPKAGTECPT